SPAALSSAAWRARSTPFVVNATSSTPGMAVRSPMRSERFARSRGSPPVSRSLRTPSFTKRRDRRTISSKESRSWEPRNLYRSWYFSRGMQYGQRKLHRSMTDIRRSRIGRPNVSRGALRPLRPFRGTTTSDLAMVAAIYGGDGHPRQALPAPGYRLPAVQARYEAFGIRVRPWRQFHKRVGTGQRGEIPGAIGGARSCPGSTPIVHLDPNGHEESQPRAVRDFSPQRHPFRRGWVLAHGGKKRRQHVPGEAYKCGYRIPRQRKDRGAGSCDTKPHRFAGALRYLVKHRPHTQLLEHRRHEIELAHRHAATQDEHVVGLQVKFQTIADLFPIVQ